MFFVFLFFCFYFLLISYFLLFRLFTEKELLTDLTAIVTLSRGCETLLAAVDDHFRNVRACCTDMSCFTLQYCSNFVLLNIEFIFVYWHSKHNFLCLLFTFIHFFTNKLSDFCSRLCFYSYIHSFIFYIIYYLSFRCILVSIF